MALIELDLYSPVEPAPGPPPGRHRPLSVAVLTILLVVLTAGSVPPRSALLRRTGLATIPGPQGTYSLVGGQLYTFHPDRTRLVTTAWSLDPLRRLWDRITPIPNQRRDGTVPELGWWIAEAAPGDVLLQAEESATVLDARTGRVRWSSPVPVNPVDGGRIGLVHEQEFRPGTRYDQSIGASGPLFFGNDGLFHTEPPLHTTLHAVDLRTGRPLWNVTLAGSVIARAAPSEPDAVLVVGSDRLAVLSARTGAVVRTRPVSFSAVRDGANFVDDLVLVRRGGPGTEAEITAYSARTLAPVWRLSMGYYIVPAFCSDLLCSSATSGMVVLDPANGRPRWRSEVGASLIGRGDVVVQLGDAATRPIAVRDAATGAVRVDLRGWTWYADSRPEDPLVLGRVSGGQMIFGVLLPGSRSVQLLGVSSNPVANCASDDRFLVCRVLGGVEAWSYL